MLGDYMDLAPDYHVPMSIVTRAEEQICGSTLEKQFALCDEILSKQPLAMAYVLALSQRDVSLPVLAHVLYLLTVIYTSFKVAMIPLTTITQEMLTKALVDTRAMALFYKNETCETERVRLLEPGISSYPEPFLLTYWITYSKNELLKGGAPRLMLDWHSEPPSLYWTVLYAQVQRNGREQRS